MHGRIAQQVFEHLLTFICRAVVIGPACARSEGVIAQHVEYANTRQRHLKEVGALCRHRTDQETAVGSAADGKPLFTGVSLIDEKFGCGDKVIEDVLLLQFGAGIVPGFPVLAAAADVGYCVHAAHLEPGCDRATEARADADIEATVGVKDGRC